MLRDRLLEIDGSLGKIRISSRQPQRKREIRSMAMLPISVSLWVLLHYIIIVMTNGQLVKKSALRERGHGEITASHDDCSPKYARAQLSF